MVLAIIYQLDTCLILQLQFCSFDFSDVVVCMMSASSSQFCIKVFRKSYGWFWARLTVVEKKENNESKLFED